MSGPTDRGGMIFFGWVLITVGALIVLLCGSCTGYFLWSTVSDTVRAGASSESQGYDSIGIVMSLVIGGLPTLLGAVMLFAGLRMWRPRQPRARDESAGGSGPPAARP